LKHTMTLLATAAAASPVWPCVGGSSPRSGCWTLATGTGDTLYFWRYTGSQRNHGIDLVRRQLDPG
jgi:hypothetical protein